jgi:hypothetical protein
LGATLFVRSFLRLCADGRGKYDFPASPGFVSREKDILHKCAKSCENARGRICIAVENGLIMSTLSPEAAENQLSITNAILDTCVERMEKGYADLV